MAQIIWTEPAFTDLNEIAEYIALDKVEAARRLVEQVFKSVGQLEQFPELGRKPPELEDSKLSGNHHKPVPNILPFRPK
jgi:toxin ParE1/3/4